jgi:hypothetical protein
MQSGVPPLQMWAGLGAGDAEVPQPPQLLGSSAVKMQFPLQR